MTPVVFLLFSKAGGADGEFLSPPSFQFSRTQNWWRA